jgi:WD40 repeat protein
MLEPASPQLIVVAVGRNEEALWPDLPVDDAARRLADLLAPCGVRERRPTALDVGGIHGLLDAWVAADGPAGNTILYWAGHGEVRDDHLWLVAENSTRPLTDSSGVPARALANYLQLDWQRRSAHDAAHDAWTVVILDCCQAGTGVANVVHELSRSPAAWPERLALLGSAQDGASFAGRLVDATARVLGRFGLNDAEIPVRDLLDLVADELSPEARYHPFELPRSAVLRNPRWYHAPLTVAVDAVESLRRVLDGLTVEIRSHFVAKAQGAELNELAWYFEGRYQETRELAGWLREAPGGMFVVTGRAGCGKSALLGRMVTLADRGLLAALERAQLIATPDDAELPPEDAFDVVVHLMGKTAQDIVSELGTALGGDLPAGGLEAVIMRLRSLDRRFTVMVDALDEAIDPPGIAGSVLRRLAAVPGVRVVVGTRRSLDEGPDLPDPVGEELLDALVLHPGRDRLLSLLDEPDSIARYVEGRLMRTESSPYRDDAGAARWLASEVADRGEPFLFARLAVAELLARPRFERGAAQIAVLDHGHRGLFARAVERINREHPRTGALLHTLAFSFGRGFPRRDRVWATATEALSPALSISERDIDRALVLAAAYITLDGDEGQSTYRLAHQTFVEHFRELALPGAGEAHRDISAALAEEGRSDGWQDLNPYLAHHLPAHAAVAGSLGELAGDSRFLAAADPDRLARAMSVLQSGAERRRRQLYVQTVNRLRGRPPAERAAILELAALQQELEIDDLTTWADYPWRARWTRWRPSAELLTLGDHEAAVTGIALGVLDGQPVVATASHDGTVRLWDARAGRLLRTLDCAASAGQGVRVAGVAVGEVDGRPVVASINVDGTVRLWDARAGRPLLVLDDRAAAGRDDRSGGIALGEVDRRTVVATARPDADARIWDARTGELRRTLTGHRDLLTGIAVGQMDGRAIVATVSLDGTARIWNAHTGELLRTLESRDVALSCVTCGEVDRQPVVATAGYDHKARLWNPRSGKLICELEGHTSGINGIALGRVRGRTVVATASHDRTARLWDASSGELVRTVQGHGDGVGDVALGEVDGVSVVATTSHDCTARLWDVRRRLLHPTRRGHTARVNGVALGEVGGRLVVTSASGDGTARLWDAGTGRPLGVLRGHRDWLAGIALGEVDGRPVASTASQDRTAGLWDARSGKLIRLLRGHGDGVSGVALGSVDGQPVVATASADGTARLWDPRSGQLVRTLEGHDGGVTAIALGRVADIDAVATAGADGTARLWDAVSGRPHLSLTGHRGGVTGVALARVDGRCAIATASQDSTARLWDAATGVLLRVLEGHSGGVHGVAFGDIGGRAVIGTAGSDRTARLWDAVSGRPLLACPVGEPVYSIATGSGFVVAGCHRGIVAIECRWPGPV